MKRIALASAAIFIVGFTSAVLLLVAADAKLDQRKEDLLATRCAQRIDVPAAVSAFNWVATILLLIAAGAAVVFIVSVVQLGSVVLKVSAVIVAGLALVITVGYALLVGSALIDPSSEEPSSPRYHPCGQL